MTAELIPFRSIGSRVQQLVVNSFSPKGWPGASHENSTDSEVFNLYNATNLSGYSGDLTSAAFGQPTSRVTQVFGSGGPRAFQLGVRVGF